MHREHHRWWSPALHRDMDLLSFGHAGATVLAFPTSRGTFWEWEHHGLVRALSHRINAGHLRLVTVDSVDGESWYSWDKPAHARAWRQCEYDGYVSTEVLPFIRGRGGNPFVVAAGASFGAFHALSVALRHPHHFGRVVSMSGLCDIRLFTRGDDHPAVCPVNPPEFVPAVRDPAHLAALRRLDIVLAVGDGDHRLCEQNRHLSGVLWRQGVGNALREWDGFAHDWPVWDRMLDLYVGGHD